MVKFLVPPKNYDIFPSDSGRYLTLFKADKSTIIRDDATFTLGAETKRNICHLLKMSPLSQKEKCDLKRTESKSLSGNIQPFRISIGGLTSGKVSIPPSHQNPDLVGVRRSLPIFAYRSQILSMIEANQVIVLSGQTGSGKTTQVPQYLLEEANRTKKNCRIICTQPRRLSAISVAERVCQERNERVGQTIGYQIRLESRISSNSNLIYCTNGVLLRCLMSGNADELFGQITHIIVDEVHERDKFSDFLLISIKENLHLNPNTKIILMSATIDANVFTKYFNDAPHIEIPGRLYDVEILPLEHVLLEIGYKNPKIDEAKKKLHLLEAKKIPEKVVVEPKPKSTVHLDDETRELLDDTFKSWWLTQDDGDEAFNQFTYMVASENVPIDFCHSDTNMTALMIVAGKGCRPEVQILLEMGADPFIKCRGDYTAMDLAVQMGHNECAAFLASVMKLKREQKSDAALQPVVQSQYDPKMAEIVLDAYQTTTNEDEIDHGLLFDVIAYIHQSFQIGSILVFLPGYDDIIEANDRLTKFLRNPAGFAHKIFMLHSNMQILDQKS
jgi:ATP-dependent RNA helicase YTHDC2